MTTAPRLPEQLISECQGLVHSLAKKIHRQAPPGVELEDLASYGQVGLAEAARDFNAELGNRFSTYAYYRIRGSIYDGMSKMSWFSRAQYNRLKYERLADDVLRLESQEAGEREEDELSWFRRVTASLALVYLSSHAPGGEEDGGESEISDPNSSTPETQVVSRETAQKLHESIEELPEESRNLIKAAYFEGLTLQDAGKRLGVSKSWASRMHAKALQRLAIALRGIGEASG